MTSIPIIRKNFYYLGKALLDEMEKHCSYAEIESGTEILSAGKYVKVVPIVIDGLIKVFSKYEDKELLLYYIQSNESCIMSFNACIQQQKSNVYGVVLEDAKLLLIPAEKISVWIIEFPQLNSLFYQQYHLRYNDLLDTINNLLFYKLDHRLMEYLRQKQLLTGKGTITLTHREIASEMGTAREVISRILKKLEKENKVEQVPDGIKLL